MESKEAQNQLNIPLSFVGIRFAQDPSPVLASIQGAEEFVKWSVENTVANFLPDQLRASCIKPLKYMKNARMANRFQLLDNKGSQDCVIQFVKCGLICFLEILVCLVAIWTPLVQSFQFENSSFALHGFPEKAFHKIEDRHEPLLPIYD